MREKLKQIKLNNRTNSLIILTLIFVIFLISSYFFYQSYKSQLVEKSAKEYSLNIEYLNSKLDLYVQSYDKKSLEINIQKLINTKIFNMIEVQNERYIFDVNTLYLNTKDFSDKSWNLVEVVVDARYGYINRLPKSKLYEFIPSKEFDPKQAINIRYQVFKKGQLKNILTKINFSDTKIEDFENKEENSWFNSSIDINTQTQVYDVRFNNIKVSTVVYSLNNNVLVNELKSFLFKLVIFNIIFFLPITFVLVFYHKYLFDKYVVEPVNYLNKYLDDVLNNKFRVIDKNKFEATDEIKGLTKRITKVATKVASLKNELNVNKESLELKSSTDSLTGLPNKSIFDLDIKTMFVSMTKGYIFQIRLDSLAQISKNHDSGYINNFIEGYTNVIKNVAFNYSKTDVKLYRFYGSQFAIIARNIDYDTAKKMSEEIIFEIKDRIPDIYDVPEELIQIGVTEFDLYGSLDTVMASANKAYQISKEKGINSYHILGLEEIEKDYSLLEDAVLRLIKDETFEIKYILESYLFDEKKLAMTEAAPKLFDHEGKTVPIGSFVSIANKLNLVEEFDKLVVKKVVNDIIENSFEHEVAINLAISSIKNEKFISWLANFLEENIQSRDKVVFSITSYTAYLHKEAFTNFIEKVHKMGAKVILKRYKTDEFPLTQLEFLNLDYIRMNKDYTANFTNDIVKKHKVKNIIIFSELNNIKVFADSVKLQSDYDMLERLGTYATSR